MKLTIVEKFMLIAQHPEKGRFIIPEIQLHHGIIGAMLIEMSFNEMINIEKDRLRLKNYKKSNDPIINEIALKIRKSKKPRRIKYWITTLAGKSRKYKWVILNGLVKNKLIRIENRKFLGLIPYRKHYLTESKTRNNLIQELKKSVLSRREISDENIVVLGLIEACKMHKVLTTDKSELKRIKKELKQIIKESPIAGTVDKTIKEVQAAIMVAMVASTVATTSGSS